MIEENKRLESELARLEGELSAALEARADDARIAADRSSRLNRLETAINLVPVGVILANEHGEIISGNAQVERMLRHPVIHSADIESYGGWISFHEDGRQVQSHEYPLARIIGEGQPHAQIDVHYQRGDGTKFWMRIIGEPVKNAAGERVGAAVALVDIDEQRQLLAQQKTMIGELNHRVKNAFAVVKSIVSQSLRKARVAEGLRETIDRRLDAYAKAHAKLIGSTWEGTAVKAVAADILPQIGGASIHFDGPEIELTSRHAMALSMALYELATNAVKYGALSVPDGTATFTWDKGAKESGEGELSFAWTERGGPVPVETTEKGFGSIIIDRALAMETNGTVRISYPNAGFEWSLKMPIEMPVEEIYD